MYDTFLKFLYREQSLGTRAEISKQTFFPLKKQLFSDETQHKNNRRTLFI